MRPIKPKPHKTIGTIAEARGARHLADDKFVRVARQAAIYCLHHFPMLWTAGEPHPQEGGWLVPVVVPYPTGHGGEIGQLSYDGNEFSELTSRDEMAARARAIEEDPILLEKWHQTRASLSLVGSCDHRRANRF